MENPRGKDASYSGSSKPSCVPPRARLNKYLHTRNISIGG